MSVPLTVNGTIFNFPITFDIDWGDTVTNWATAITDGVLQKSGGYFPLTGTIDFGPNNGIKLLSLTSEETNPAHTGVIRLGNASTGIVWRNATNSADLGLTVSSGNQLQFNGVNIGATAALTNGHILVGNGLNQPADVAMSGDITINNTGVTTLGALKVTDSQISATAAIALTKLASSTPYSWYTSNSAGVLAPIGVTASKAVITDANGLPSTSTVTSTELSYVHGVTSAIQTQLNAITPYLVPSGAMLDFAGTVAPTGWLLCDGSSYATATYPTLFSAIGYTWGGSGANFNVPNMTRKVGVGSGGSGTATLGNAVGNTGGTETVTPGVTDPGHNHTQNQHQHVTGVGASGSTINVSNDATPWSGGVSNIAQQVAQVGGSIASGSINFLNTTLTTATNNSNTTGITVNASNILQPSAVVLKIIRI